MKTVFYKMNALGNDYIFFNAINDNNFINLIIPNIQKLSDRHFGIGGDGVIIIESSEIADCKMRIFNSDGSEGTMCGNGIRELAKLVWDKNIISKKKLYIETLSGIREISLFIDSDNLMKMATVNMGKINFNISSNFFDSLDNQFVQSIPVFYHKYQSDTICFYIGAMGGHHAACIVLSDIENIDYLSIGKLLETNKKIFPNGINIEFINILSLTKINMRVWERGSGHTLACGTGATFSVGLGMKLGLLDSTKEIEVLLERGSLFISKNQDDTLNMRGGADLVFEGMIELSPPSI